MVAPAAARETRSIILPILDNQMPDVDDAFSQPILQPDVTSGIELTDSDDFPTTEVDSDSDWADGEVALVGGDFTFIEDVDLDHGKSKSRTSHGLQLER